jgi:hypothetical protein
MTTTPTDPAHPEIVPSGDPNVNPIPVGDPREDPQTQPAPDPETDPDLV